METLPALILIFSFCAAAAALIIVIFHAVRRNKNNAPAVPPLNHSSGKSSSINSTELQTVLDSITDYICIIDTDFQIRYANRSYQALTGGGDTGGVCHVRFWKRALPCEQCPARETMQNGVPVLRKNVVLQTEQDGKKYLEVSTYPVIDKSNRVVRVIEYIRDMTRETTMLDELIRSEKLAGIGAMTSGIAHEMNNALSGIAGTASNLLTMPEKYGLNEKGVDRVFSILDSATRATGVMKNLLHFSSPLPDETRTMVNIGQLLKKITASAYIQEAKDIERSVTFDEALPLVNADLSKIELAFMNIIANAVCAVRQKKTICRKNGVSFKGSLAVCAAEKQKKLHITFTDNGVGVPENVRDKIFDPFFSTWPDGSGTGLGLSTAMYIVQEHGGRIFFESTDDATTFTIELPLTAPQSGIN
jgi:nitrogen-specific signal transduction histidine kinase